MVGQGQDCGTPAEGQHRSSPVTAGQYTYSAKTGQATDLLLIQYNLNPALATGSWPKGNVTRDNYLFAPVAAEVPLSAATTTPFAIKWCDFNLKICIQYT